MVLLSCFDPDIHNEETLPTASDMERPCSMCSSAFVEGLLGPTARRGSMPWSYSQKWLPEGDSTTWSERTERVCCPRSLSGVDGGATVEESLGSEGEGL